MKMMPDQYSVRAQLIRFILWFVPDGACSRTLLDRRPSLDEERTGLARARRSWRM